MQLQDILQSRLSPLHTTELAVEIKKFLPPPTLMLLTKKVAALTGDVRSLFEVLRGAIDLAVAPSTTRKSVDENPFNPPKATVTPQHILAALKAYTPAAHFGCSKSLHPCCTLGFYYKFRRQHFPHNE